jgi:hypothetical protein
MSQRVNIYSYTAASNPYFVRSLAHKYGYEFDKEQPLASVLQQLVNAEGEPVLMEIIENNPDKELFMDYFKKKMSQEESTKEEKQPTMMDAYMNFSGALQMQQAVESKKFTNETSLMVLAGAVLIAFAILTRK